MSVSGPDTTPGEAPIEHRPAIWRVMHQAAGMVDAILLGDQSNDAWRVGVTIVGHGDDGPEVEATVVYPCRTCGWADACDGECHS